MTLDNVLLISRTDGDDANKQLSEVQFSRKKGMRSLCGNTV